MFIFLTETVWPVLRAATRACMRDPVCDTITDAFWLSYFEVFFVLGTITAIRFGADRPRRLTKIMRLKTLRIAELGDYPSGQPVELHGHVRNQAPQVGPLSQEQVAAYVLTIRGTWQSGRVAQWTKKEEKFTDGLVLDDGTGTVQLRVTGAQRYWLRKKASWRPPEVPDWATPPPAPGLRLAQVSAVEEYLPQNSEVFVIGVMNEPQTIDATTISYGKEHVARRGLLTELGSVLGIVGLSLFFASWLAKSFVGTWAQGISLAQEANLRLDWGLLIYSSVIHLVPLILLMIFTPRVIRWCIQQIGAWSTGGRALGG